MPYLNRIEKVRQLMIQDKVEAVLITSVPNIIYLTGYANFSPEEREAFLLITEDKQYILTDGRYETAIKNEVKHFELFPISSKYPAMKAIKSLLDKHEVKSLGIEERNLTIFEFNQLKLLISAVLPLNTLSLRLIKDDSEIQAIEKACRLGDLAFKYILKLIKPGITELELASQLELFILKRGGRLSFPTIAAFGQNAAVPHHETGNTVLKKQDLILLDFGVKLNNYRSDMTRTVFIGSPTNEQKKIYETVLQSQDRAIKLLNSKIAMLKTEDQPIYASEIDKGARDYILSKDYPSIPHSLGHGIGLQVHEPPTLSPVSSTKLTEGMVFTIEPGIYLPGKTGVRIEDLFVINKGTLRQLTQSSKELIIL